MPQLAGRVWDHQSRTGGHSEGKDAPCPGTGPAVRRGHTCSAIRGASAEVFRSLHRAGSTQLPRGSCHHARRVDQMTPGAPGGRDNGVALGSSGPVRNWWFGPIDGRASFFPSEIGIFSHRISGHSPAIVAEEGDSPHAQASGLDHGPPPSSVPAAGVAPDPGSGRWAPTVVPDPEPGARGRRGPHPCAPRPRLRCGRGDCTLKAPPPRSVRRPRRRRPSGCCLSVAPSGLPTPTPVASLNRGQSQRAERSAHHPSALLLAR